MTKEEFIAFIKENNNGCWIWQRSKDTFGYGQQHFDGRQQGAHCVSYQLFVGEISDGLWVLHKCDVPACVNPEHLFLGTYQDNIDDRKKKGRNGFHAAYGLNNGNGKLSDDDIRYIRAFKPYYGYRQFLADKFNISPFTVRDIRRGKKRATVPQLVEGAAPKTV